MCYAGDPQDIVLMGYSDSDYAGDAAEDDLLPTRLPDKVKKPKWAKPRKTHSKGLLGHTLELRLLKLLRIRLNMAVGRAASKQPT